MKRREYVLGIELGGSHATCGIMHRNVILASKTISFPSPAYLNPLLPSLSSMLIQLMAEVGIDTTQCAGLGMAFCGAVDAKRNRVWCIFRGKYDDVMDINLVSWCQDTFGLPFQIENDARMALLGEWIGGAARGCNDVVMVLLGTGFGTAAIMEGRPVRGRYSLAAARGGHFSITLAPTSCICGNIGCVETRASTWHLSQISKRPEFASLSREPGRIYSNFHSLLDACDEQDPGAIALMEHCIRVWSAATITLVHAYDADTVIVGGGIMKASSRILPPLAESIRDHAWTPWGKVDVRPAQLGENAGLLGITSLFDVSSIEA